MPESEFHLLSPAEFAKEFPEKFIKARVQCACDQGKFIGLSELQMQVCTLLYLTDKPFTTDQIVEILDLSSRHRVRQNAYDALKKLGIDRVRHKDNVQPARMAESVKTSSLRQLQPV